jgi:hypothetical protein
MKKLTLRIDNLKVDSFETAGIREELRGTVAAHAKPRPFEPTEAVTGSCCDITLALSCVQTNCFNECFILTADTCV